MDTEKHGNIAVFLYLMSLLFVVVYKIIKDASYLDIIYLVVVVCCVLKFLIIMHDKRK